MDYPDGVSRSSRQARAPPGRAVDSAEQRRIDRFIRGQRKLDGGNNPKSEYSAADDEAYHKSSHSTAKEVRRNKPRNDPGRVYCGSEVDSKYDERPSRRAKSHKGRGSLAGQRRTMPLHHPERRREHKRPDYCEPEPPENDSDDSFTHRRDGSYSRAIEYHIPRTFPIEDWVLNSDSSSGLAGYYGSGGLHPPFDTGPRYSTQHGSRQDETQYDRYGTRGPVRYTETSYTPARPGEFDRATPRQIEGSDRHHRLLEAPSHIGSSHRRR